jgi:hypothetical protein
VSRSGQRSRPATAKIVIAPHPHKIVDGRRHYLIRAIPYQDPEMEAARLLGHSLKMITGRYLDQLVDQLVPLESACA